MTLPEIFVTTVIGGLLGLLFHRLCGLRGDEHAILTVVAFVLVVEGLAGIRRAHDRRNGREAIRKVWRH